MVQLEYGAMIGALVGAAVIGGFIKAVWAKLLNGDSKSVQVELGVMNGRLKTIEDRLHSLISKDALEGALARQREECRRDRFMRQPVEERV